MTGALQVCLCALLLGAPSALLLDDGVRAMQTGALIKSLGEEFAMLNTSSLKARGFDVDGLSDETATSCFTSQFSGHSCYGGVSCMVAKMCGSPACTTKKECIMTKKGTPKCHPKKCPLCDKFESKGGKKVKSGKKCKTFKTDKTKEACEKHFKWCEGGGRVQKCLGEYKINMGNTASDKGKEFQLIHDSIKQKKPVPMSLAHCRKSGKCSGHAVLVVATATHGDKKFLGLLDPWAPRCKAGTTKDYEGKEVHPNGKSIHWTPYKKSGPNGNKDAHIEKSYKIPSGFEGARAEQYFIISSGCNPDDSQCSVEVESETPPEGEMDAMDEDEDEADDDDEAEDEDDN